MDWMTRKEEEKTLLLFHYFEVVVEVIAFFSLFSENLNLL